MLRNFDMFQKYLARYAREDIERQMYTSLIRDINILQEQLYELQALKDERKAEQAAFDEAVSKRY